MNHLQPSQYRKLFLLGLLVQVVAAWFSVGYHHPDEHFQVLEFCNYKLGYSPAADLPWEYAAKCRTAILPFIAYLLSKVLIALHLYNPFTAAFILRLGMGIFTWWVTCWLIRVFSGEFITRQGQYLYILCSFFLWYVPYIGVRFSSENLAGLLFFLSILLLYNTAGQPYRKKIIPLVAIGFLLGFSVFIRLQMAFAVLGLGVWMLFVRKKNWTDVFTMLPGALVAMALGLCIDYWFYGAWTFTAYNYYTVNITQNVAAKWGLFPWWYYLKLFIESAAIPISIALLALFINGLRKKPAHLCSLVCIFFIICHSIIGHKEMRFLYPVNMAFIFLVCMGIDDLIGRYSLKPVLLNTFKVLAVINVALLLFKIFTPAQEAFKYYSYLYNYAQGDNTPRLAGLKESPYRLNQAEVNFFKPKQLEAIQVYQSEDSIMAALKEDKGTLYLSRNILPADTCLKYDLKKVYCMFPDAILKFNINQWEDRSNIWAVYQRGDRP